MNESRREIRLLKEKNKALEDENKAIQDEKDAEIQALQDKLDRIKVSEKKMRSLIVDVEKMLYEKLGSKN